MAFPAAGERVFANPSKIQKSEQIELLFLEK